MKFFKKSIFFIFLFFQFFLDKKYFWIFLAPSELYKGSCRSVGPSVVPKTEFDFSALRPLGLSKLSIMMLMKIMMKKITQGFVPKDETLGNEEVLRQFT